jgi:hypothetical protein
LRGAQKDGTRRYCRRFVKLATCRGVDGRSPMRAAGGHNE